MGVAKQLKMIMLDKGIKTKVLAEMVGIKPENVYNSFSKDNMTFDRAKMFADALGCDIVFMDRETGKIY